MTAIGIIVGLLSILLFIWCLFSDPDLDGWHPYDEDDDEK